MTAGDASAACRRSSSGATGLLRSTLIPLPAGSAGSRASLLVGLTTRCGVAGGGLGVAAPFVSSDTVVPCPAAALRRIRSGNGPVIRCAYTQDILLITQSHLAMFIGACLVLQTCAVVQGDEPQCVPN